jgi:hypothetical protein
MFVKTTVAAVLGGALLIGGALPAMADWRSDCENRIRRDEDNLRRDIAAHGEHGKNVEKRREVLERDRQNCRMVEERERERHEHEHEHEHNYFNHEYEHDMR